MIEETRIPQHRGPHVLPDFPLFHRLLFQAYRTNRLAIHDVTNNKKATHAELLSDILHLRNALWQRLSAEIQVKLLHQEEIPIALLAIGSYEFAVGFLATAALGAIVVPISVAVPTEEASYLVRTSKAVAVLVTSSQIDAGVRLATRMKDTRNASFFSFDISSVLKHPMVPLKEISISSDYVLSPTRAGLIIFTSGTTGPPKGAVKKRDSLTNNAQAFGDWYDIKDTDIVYHTLPVHHATGITVTFLAPLICGACIQFHSGGFSPVKVWKGWKEGASTIFSGVPTMYQRMMQYYEDEICKRPPHEVQQYQTAARRFRLMMCGTSALPYPLQTKWIKLLGGKRILERYGGTEFSGVLSVLPADRYNPDGSVGKVFPGVEVRLSQGDEGEILIRSPFMFTKYINDPVATAAAFTSDGWYRSGDIARREDDYYFILGRASIDIIKSGGYKISALDIERELLGLDYIGEAVIVGVDDEEYGQKVAAAVVLREQAVGQSVSIARLRADLRQRLAGYKLPLLLRIVSDFPRTASGKVVKKKVRDELFPLEGHPEIQTHVIGKTKL